MGLVSLGCPKNLVDLQVMAGELTRAGFRLAPSPEDADVILVNTCAFIEEAREEAASEIVWACERKQRGQCKAVVVAGCLPQRYPSRTLPSFPGVDAVLGTDDLDALPDLLRRIVHGETGIAAVSATVPRRVFTPPQPDLVLTGGPFAYLKIADGCDHVCAYCAIPLIRGHYRSRPQAELVEEARALVASGIREICIVAQDATAYGKDFSSPITGTTGTSCATLVALLRALDGIDGDFWIRLLYGYPNGVTDELLAWMAQSPHACRYLDVPLQHSHPDILRAMRRAETVPLLPDFADRLRAAVPGITLRTTFLVGFPGENEDHFDHLRNYIASSKFDHVGVFAYSPEAGTAAFETQDDSVDDVVAESRRATLLQLQSTLVDARLARRRDKEDVFLLDQPHLDENDRETGLWVARSQGQAPEDLDGVTLVAHVPALAMPGQFIRARYTGHSDYDLLADFLSMPPHLS